MKVSLISFIHNGSFLHQNTSASVSEICGEWRAFRKVSRPQKTKVNVSPKQRGLLQCYRRYFKPSRFSKP
ncbi:MAG: hypothetical protein GDA51_03280 [Ekhidna sp.]|nr:hypothetical protein [Ekhidna sp.]